MLMSLRSIAHLLVVPVLRTPQAEKMEFSFTDICARIGKPASPKEVEYAKIRVRDQDDLAMLRRAQREQNTLPETMRITKQELENEKVEVIDDNEIVQTKTDPENIDPLYVSRAYEGKLCPYSKLVWLIDAKGQKKTKNPRVIPHFDRLFVKTQLYCHGTFSELYIRNQQARFLWTITMLLTSGLMHICSMRLLRASKVSASKT